MSLESYVGVSGTPKKIIAYYVGVDNKAKLCKKVYVGDSSNIAQLSTHIHEITLHGPYKYSSSSAYVDTHHYYNKLCTVCNKIVGTQLEEHNNRTTYVPYSSTAHRIKRTCQTCGNVSYSGPYACTFNSISRTEPTCTVDGVEISECSKCNNQSTTTLPKLGHDWTKWTSGSAASYLYCKKRTCNRCGEEEIIEHDWDTSTGVCKVCGKTDGPQVS